MSQNGINGLKERLSHVYFIGGAPCSGKSTVVDLLAARFGLFAYHIDQHIYQYFNQMDPQRQPVMYKWANNPWETLWMQSHEVLFYEVVAAYQEQLEIVLEELLCLPGEQPVIAEGNPFMPHLLAPLLMTHNQAIWLVSTSQFLRKTYLGNRVDMVNHILRDCSQPDQAADNWMNRDVAFAEWVRKDAHNLELEVMDVDGSRSIQENVEIVASHFLLSR